MTATPSISEPRDHVGELHLRRFRLGELSAADASAIEAHTNGCATCRAKLRALEEEESAFRTEISFDQFAAGVSRAHRVPRAHRRRTWGIAVGLAAAAALLIFFRGGEKHFTNSIKGENTLAQLRIAGARGQRPVDPGTVDSLQPGDRVRVGYRIAAPSFLVAVSLDDQGKVTPLYPEAGPAMPAEPAHELRFLPDSLEFTGAGKERVFLLIAPTRFTVEAVERAALDGFRASHGNLDHFMSLPSPITNAISFTWLLAKP